MKRHWAFDLIGKPWSPGGVGPDDYSCWGLVRHVFLVRYGVDMPIIKTGPENEDGEVASIKRAAEASGFRPASEPAQDGDIVLLQGIEGRHVGVMAAMSTGLVLLHANGWDTRHGSVGSVVAEPLADVLGTGGYRNAEYWRRAA